MNLSPPPSRLRLLVERHLDASLTRVEMAEFEELLREPGAMDYYLQAVEIEAGLQQLDASGELFTEQEANSPIVTMPSRGHRVLLASAAAVLLLLAVGVLLVAVKERPAGTEAEEPPTAIEIARVIRHIGLPAPPQSVVRTGDTLVIGSGLLELELRAGPRLLLEGPAELELTDTHQVRLAHGRCLVTVPRSKTRFTFRSAQGSVWALDSEFAVAVPRPGAAMEIGVLEGRAYLGTENSSVSLPVGRRDAIRISAGSGPRSISFPFESFHRRFPARELAWRAPSNSFQPVVLEHDINGLIWGSGPYRVYFKWMHGPDALIIHSSEVLLDGEPVAADVHHGIAGDPLHTEGHAYHFDIPEASYRPGAWTLRTTVQTNPRHLGQIQLPDEILNPRGVVLLADDPRLTVARARVRPTITVRPNSHGVLLVEQGNAAQPYDFCHEWEYVHNGLIYRRTFFENGTARLERDDEVLTNFDRATWTVEDGVLTLSICHPDTDDLQCIERHLLRDKNTLLFLDRPYRNARRIVGP
jgi:ferric-dicitrate binding protein FerR (iron transport regulator)